MAHLDELNERIRQLELEIAESRKAIGDIQREQLFSEKVLDSLPGIFYLYNQDGDIIRWNKNHETLTGYNAEELPAATCSNGFQARTRHAWLKGQLLFKGAFGPCRGTPDRQERQRVPYYFTGVRMTVDRRKYLLGVGIDLTEPRKPRRPCAKAKRNTALFLKMPWRAFTRPPLRGNW